MFRRNDYSLSIVMEDTIIEATYPITFRSKDARFLGEHLKSRHSVVLIGMKRVGISNFLRFFLYHNDIAKTYINTKKQLFIPIDLNDLVEREIFPFWTLTLKRIVDAVNKSILDAVTKKEIESLFLESIQLHDLFLTIDSVRQSLVKIVEHDMMPSLFFLRFDRVKDIITPEFFANLQGLRDATHQKLSYLFTSYRSLDILSPGVFQKASLSVFAQNMYIEPAEKEDTRIIYNTYRNRYKLSLPKDIEQALFNTVDGYVQYLQLALISLHERKKTITDKSDLFDFLVTDERISLQSEELWENLTVQEQEVLIKISNGANVKTDDKQKASYLWDTGYVVEKKGVQILFSPLFSHYLLQKEKKIVSHHIVEFTKKEHMLFSYLKENLGKICEREKIIEAVWPEVVELGISDWAIDRLVARVRSKLKLQKSTFEVQTIKTRGYKLLGVA